MKNDTKLFHRLALFVCASAVSVACAMGADPAAAQPSVDATLAGSTLHAHDDNRSSGVQELCQYAGLHASVYVIASNAITAGDITVRNVHRRRVAGDA
jgi:hypothetical protein